MLVISNIPGVKGLDRAKAADIPTKVSVCIGFMTIYYYFVKLDNDDSNNNNIENDNNGLATAIQFFTAARFLNYRG